MASFFNEGIHTGSDEVMSLKAPELCEPCFSDCKEVTAFVYCLDCDEKFCVACGNCHKKSKISKDHKLCNLGEAPPAHVVQLMKELTTCPNHQSEEVVYICVNEDLLCCNQCVNTKHRHCRQLKTIEQCLKEGLAKQSAFTHEQIHQESHQQKAQAHTWNAVGGQHFGYGTELVHRQSWDEFNQPEVDILNIDPDRAQVKTWNQFRGLCLNSDAKLLHRPIIYPNEAQAETLNLFRGQRLGYDAEELHNKGWGHVVQGEFYDREVNFEPDNVQTEGREDINTLSKRLCERSIDLHEQLENITKHEVKHEIAVSGTPERVQDYLQVVHAKLESAFNTLQTNLMAQCQTQTNDLLTIIRRQQTSAINLQKQIKSNQEKMTSIKKHGKEKHLFLLSRKMNKDLNEIENSTRTLENNKTLSSLKIVEKCSVNEIINNIVQALLIQKDSARSPSKKGQRLNKSHY